VSGGGRPLPPSLFPAFCIGPNRVPRGGPPGRAFDPPRPCLEGCPRLNNQKKKGGIFPFFLFPRGKQKPRPAVQKKKNIWSRFFFFFPFSPIVAGNVAGQKDGLQFWGNYPRCRHKGGGPFPPAFFSFAPQLIREILVGGGGDVPVFLFPMLWGDVGNGEERSFKGGDAFLSPKFLGGGGKDGRPHFTKGPVRGPIPSFSPFSGGMGG